MDVVCRFGAEAPNLFGPKTNKAAAQHFKKVAFEDRYLTTQVGIITRINQRSATIDTGTAKAGGWVSACCVT